MEFEEVVERKTHDEVPLLPGLRLNTVQILFLELDD